MSESPFSRVYLSLGSNQGDRLSNLQYALDQLQQEAGKVKLISSVYVSKSWGFSGDDFLNCCIGLETPLLPLDLLHCCLTIERRAGRERKAEMGYQSRYLDIDIIFYDDLIINNKELKVPHPEFSKRKFVLLPLAEIAPGKIDAAKGKSVSELLEELHDPLEVTRYSQNLNHPLYLKFFKEVHYVAIEGNIGVGKTSLATKISMDFKAKLILERFEDNPFLPKFYEQPSRYALPLEMSFLADRYQQFTEDTLQPDLFNSFLVSDYDIHKSLIFAKVTLSGEEFRLYQRLFQLMYKQAIRPDLYVYLYQNEGRLLDNIRQRGRRYEQHIESAYLKNIHLGYMDFFQTLPESKRLLIDITDRDFLVETIDYLYILDKMFEHWKHDG